MSSKTEVVRKWHEESYENPPARALAATEKYLADNYQNLDKNGSVIGDKAAFVGMTGLLYQAFNDFKGVVHDVSEQDGGVMLTFHFEGTHTGDFDLTPMGLGIIPATGRRVVTPEAKTLFMVEGDQIVSSRPVSGGFEDLLAAVGAPPPPA